MRFLLFVEGHAEKVALPAFLKRWLDARTNQRVGVTPLRFEGWADYRGVIAKKVQINLAGKTGAGVIGAIGLLDLYGPTFYPAGVTTASDRYRWAKKDIETEVAHPLFRQHFAVHQLEACLLAAPEAFPQEVKAALSKPQVTKPEGVNFGEPPGYLLDRLYYAKLKRHYKKTTDGHELFARLDPDAAADKCPALKAMLEDMLQLARDAGL